MQSHILHPLSYLFMFKDVIVVYCVVLQYICESEINRPCKFAHCSQVGPWVSKDF